MLFQLFNEVNARKIDDSLNIFAGITKNYLFLFIWFGTLVVQIILVHLAASFFKCSNYGLDFSQWLICIGFGLLSWPVGLITKYLPDFKDQDAKPEVVDIVPKQNKNNEEVMDNILEKDIKKGTD